MISAQQDGPLASLDQGTHFRLDGEERISFPELEIPGIFVNPIGTHIHTQLAPKIGSIGSQGRANLRGSVGRTAQVRRLPIERDA
jgi:hypothetical protein